MKVGDVVRLKSGGPTMTVLGQMRTNDLRIEAAYAVAWFCGAEMHTASAPADALEIVPVSDAKSPVLAGG